MLRRAARSAALVTLLACAPEPEAPAPVGTPAPSPSPFGTWKATLPPTLDPARTCAEEHPKPYPEITGPRPAPPASALPSASSSAGVSGGVSRAGEVVASMAAGFRRCYQRGLRCDAEMQGTSRVEAKIGADGKVVGVKTTFAKGLSRGVLDCLQEVVSSKTFDAPDGGGATIVIPISFFPQTDEAPPK